MLATRADAMLKKGGLDTHRTAKLLIDQRGEDAPIHAAMQADELLEAGDLDGAAVLRDTGDGAGTSVRVEFHALAAK